MTATPYKPALVVPKTILQKPLSAWAKLVWGQLKFHQNRTTGQCNPRYSKLAEELSTSVDTIGRAVRELRQAGLISTIKRVRASSYTLYEEPTFPTAEKSVENRGKPSARHADLRSLDMRICGLKKPQIRNSKEPSSIEPVQREPLKATGVELKKIDDDEKPKTPESQFRQRLLDRHGQNFPIDDCIRNVQRQLEKCYGLTFVEFAAYDQARTTGNGFRNAAGYYVYLAKELVRVTRQVATGATSLFCAAPPPEYPRNSHGRCAACGGSGRLADVFCGSCPLGKDLELLERRKKPASERQASTRQEGVA